RAARASSSSRSHRLSCPSDPSEPARDAPLAIAADLAVLAPERAVASLAAGDGVSLGTRDEALDLGQRGNPPVGRRLPAHAVVDLRPDRWYTDTNRAPSRFHAAVVVWP